MGSLIIITLWKNETTLVHSRINLQVRYAVHKNIEKQGLNQTQLKIFFYIDDTPSNHTWGKKIEGYQCEKTWYIYRKKKKRKKEKKP